MPGIGDYIHYSNANYRKFGTNRTGESNYNEAIKVFEEQRHLIMKTIVSTRSTNLPQLEKYLNGLLYGREIDGAKLSDEEWSYFIKKFYNQFDEKFANFGVIFDSSNALQAYAKKKIAPEDTSLSINRIKQYIYSIERSVKKMNSNGANTSDILEFNQAIDALNMLSQQVDDKTGLVNLKNIPASESILNQINRVLNRLSFPTPLATGSALEYFLAAAGNYANERANIEADKLVDGLVSKVVGQEGSAAIINASQFSEYVDVKELANLVSETWQLNNDTNLEMKLATQDKLDVILNWRGDTYNVTAKNYMLKDHKMVTLVSGAPLLTFINGENPDFINHWLNTVTMNDRERKANANLELAHIAMKLTILAKALTGQGTGKVGVADTFIINNRSAHRIEVYSTHQILDKIERQINTAAKFAGYPDIIKNVWVGKGAIGSIPSTASAQERITHLLAQLSTFKITASINYDAIAQG